MNGKHGAIFGPNDPKLRKLRAFAAWFEDWHADLTRRFDTAADVHDNFISMLCYFDLRLAVHGFLEFCNYYLAPPEPSPTAPPSSCPGDDDDRPATAATATVMAAEPPPEVRMIWPQFFNQDLLEHHFRNIRGASGDQKNPTAAQCEHAAMNSTVIRLTRNSKGKGNNDSAELQGTTQKLHKRQRKR